MDLAHQAGAIGIVMPEVSSLGVVTPPSGYGADITCGDIQPLGIHMQYGSGCGGFIAMDNDPDYVNELPTYLYGISETQKRRAVWLGPRPVLPVQPRLPGKCQGILWHGMRPMGHCGRGLPGYHGAPGHAGAGPADLVLCRLRHKAPVRPARRHRQPSRRPGVPGIHGGLPGHGENPWRRFTKPCWPGTSLAVWTWARFSPAYAGYALYCVSDTTTAADIDTLCAALHDILGGTGA